MDNADDDLASDLTAIDRSFGALRDIEVSERRPFDREQHIDRMWRHTS